MPALAREFSGLSPTSVFVPLCGKSRDLLWLRAQGHEVIGVELSALPCEEFFKENALPFTSTQEADFKVFRADRITVYQDDYFNLKKEFLANVAAVYDRAALIALPPELRLRYVARMKELLRSNFSQPGFRFLQLLLERVPADSDGPPFSVSEAVLQEHYGRDFKIIHLSRKPLEGRAPAGAQAFEMVFCLEALEQV